jgi:uncharacterized protein YjbJ (UPF0337 family)
LNCCLGRESTDREPEQQVRWKTGPQVKTEHGAQGVEVSTVRTKSSGRNIMKSSTQDEAEGKLHEVKGSIKEIAGKITKNRKLERKGKAEKLAGKVQEKVGQVKKVIGK